MKDPYGAVLALLRADAGVTAIAGTKVSSVVASVPPCVQLIDNATTRRPFGAGSGRLGLQYWQGIAKTYGTDDPAGAVLARQLAGAVSDALHNHGPYAGSTFLFRVYAPDIDGLDRDPVTKWPFYTVRIECYAATQAVA